ncbi:hypothetical protein MAPG_00228 [Magnaporthiopsis poae ATCC 64411]|uniref:Uncharacterized protein n=1 Tax=Magnaporthiopsis poae (strain ATCC 64411 / 73-15) TaxID=644358 RepID=A0A0C4DKF7_MAGP6|nr:hypothetical protein MAPG_00228 [Magnaporthiopsis poae ATCC 64411]
MKSYDYLMSLRPATMGGNDEAARLLVERGASVFAAMNGLRGVVGLRCESSADNAVNGYRRLIELVANGRDGVDPDARLRLQPSPDSELQPGRLLEHGADEHEEDGLLRTPLSLSAERGHGATVRFLVDGGADVQTRDGNDWAP